MGRGRASRVLLVSALGGMLLVPGCRRAQPPGSPAGASASEPGLLVLNDSDRNRTKPPFEDRLHILDAHGRQIRTLANLNICETRGASRAIGVSDDGETFVVCENVGQRLCAYQTRTGTRMWSLPGGFGAAVLTAGSTYALRNTGANFGDSLVVIDGAGAIVQQAQVGGFDLAVDPAHRVLWLVGNQDIKKCSLDLQVLTTLNSISLCAVSVDVAGDGSIWVAERGISEESRNRLLQIAPEGVLRQEIPLHNLTPLCVRVDRSDGSIWMTGLLRRKSRTWSALFHWPPRWITEDKLAGTRTRKYSAQGKLLVNIKRGGQALDLDRSDGSVWVADYQGSRLRHYARDGRKLEISDRLPAGEKWIAVVPAQP
jgi:hypothetical protein